VLSSCAWGRVVDRDVLVRGRYYVVCSRYRFRASDIREGDVIAT
jgi:hypothetical protein